MTKHFFTTVSITRSLNLVGAMLVAALLLLAGSMLTHEPTRAQGPNDPRRAFYLTPLTYDGSQALNACVAGFHMASMWEILDPPNLRYDTSLGHTTADSGSGPPTSHLRGWIRTGHIAHNSPTEGIGNCIAWTINSPPHEGTAVSLPLGWLVVTPTTVSPWATVTLGCHVKVRVWCVED